MLHKMYRICVLSQLRHLCFRLFGPVLLALFALPYLSLAQERPEQKLAYPSDMLAIATGFDALRDKTDAELQEDFADYVSMGVRLLRTDLNWHRIQYDGPASFDWAEADRVIHAAKSAGLEVLLVVGSVPHWARMRPNERSAIADPKTYAIFLSAAVARYAPQGIHLWEVWNEPNLDGPWPEPDAVAYATLLKAAYPAIKELDQDAIVITGGLASAVKTGPLLGPRKYISAVDFVKTLYSEGAGKSFDALGFHPYSYPRLPSDPADWNGWNLMTGPVRAVMSENGDANKRIWITEYGAPSNEEESEVSEEMQAQMVTESRQLASELSYAGPLFWYSYRDLGTDPSENEHWFGLRRADNSKKPAYDAFFKKAMR